MSDNLQKDFKTAVHCDLLLKPYRSMTDTGRKVFYGGLATVGVAMNLLMFKTTPWPASLVYAMAYNITFGALAFCMALTDRSGKEYQRITVTDDELEIRHYKPGFKEEHVRKLSPFMLRVETEQDRHGRCNKILLRSQGGQTEVGSFLNPADKAYFANKLREAVQQANTPSHLRDNQPPEPRP